MSMLDDILIKKREDIQQLYESVGLDGLKDQALEITKQSGFFFNALSSHSLSLISEVKKASPSKGIIRDVFDPVQLAMFFKDCGASALSVLTEQHFFLGDPRYIKAIKSEVSLPILRKDFIIDPIQVVESVILGADAILLIKSILEDVVLDELHQLAVSLGLDVLVEVHNVEELDAVLQLDGCRCIGFNNRNLQSFQVDLELSKQLIQHIGPSRQKDLVLVAESGYSTISQLEDLYDLSFNGVLIGEGLVKDPLLMDYFK